MSQSFDVVVIGAGPGGYVAAIRAAQLGLTVACVDAFVGKDGKPALGGTCLNVGCIPSKALLQSSEHFHALQHEFAEHGITAVAPNIDACKMVARKDGIVSKLTSGIGFLFKKHKITAVHGYASLQGRANERWQLAVAQGDTSQQLDASHVIIATGSRPRELAGFAVDNQRVLDNQGALDMDQVPARLGVIGAGVIGLEMGSVWARLGSQVTILEAAPTFLAAADQQLAKEAYKTLTRDTGLNIETGVALQGLQHSADSLAIEYQNAKGEACQLQVDKLIVAVGRVPHTAGLGADAVGLQLDARGFVVVDENCHTNLPNIWAIGDVVRGPMLAHKASEEGVAVAERIAGHKPQLDFNTIPWVIYTQPEVAWVGQTEEQLKAAGVEYTKGSSSFAANGRALGLGQAQGWVKVLADAATDRILGVHIIGPMASELIAEAVLAMGFKASSEDIALTVHAHPTLSEVLHEAALAAQQRALHG